MQQELIEMLEKVVDHVVFCNGYDQRFTSTCYGINILKEADVLLEKAKNTAPAVPRGFKPVGYLRSDEFDGHTFEPINGEWPLGELLFSVNSVSAQEAGLTDSSIDCIVYEHTKLNPNQGDDRALLTGIRHAVRDIIAALRAKENKL